MQGIEVCIPAGWELKLGGTDSQGAELRDTQFLTRREQEEQMEDTEVEHVGTLASDLTSSSSNLEP